MIVTKNVLPCRRQYVTITASAFNCRDGNIVIFSKMSKILIISKIFGNVTEIMLKTASKRLLKRILEVQAINFLRLNVF